MLTYIFVIGFPPTLYLCKDRILVPRVFDQMIYSQTLSFSKSVTVTAVITNAAQNKTKYTGGKLRVESGKKIPSKFHLQ